MNNHTRAKNGLEMLKEAVFDVLSHKEGMKRENITEELGLCLSGGAGKSGEVITGSFTCLEKKNVLNAGE